MAATSEASRLVVEERVRFVGSVLIVSPGDRDAGALARTFAHRGFVPVLAFTSRQTLRILDHRVVDIVVIDLQLVGADARAVLTGIRERTVAALVVLGEDQLSHDVIESAAVHALLHPDSSGDHVAAHAAALTGLRSERDDRIVLSHGPIELRPAERVATFGGCRLDLTPIQFRILTALVRARGAVVTKRELHRVAWGSALVDDGERVNAHIRRLRTKLGDGSGAPCILRTVRGEGYRLDVGE